MKIKYSESFQNEINVFSTKYLQSTVSILSSTLAVFPWLESTILSYHLLQM